MFTATLHRLFVSGSDRDCASWMQDYDIPGADDLSLHHFYRAMAWFGEELPKDEQKDATPFSPRTVKDVHRRRRCLRAGATCLPNLSIVFMDHDLPVLPRRRRRDAWGGHGAIPRTIALISTR